MLTFNSIKDINTWLNDLLQESVMPDVAKDAVECLKEHAQEEVYDAFDPVAYERRDSYTDDSGYDIEYSNNGFVVSDNVTPNYDWDIFSKNMRYFQWYYKKEKDVGLFSGNLLPIIESGQGYPFAFTKHVPGPRPFFTHAKAEVEGGRAEQKIEAGLRGLGFKVK